MPQMFSELCRRSKVEDSLVRKIIADGRDFDLDKITHQIRTADAERRAMMLRAYASKDVSVALMPNFSVAYDASDLIADIVCPVMPGNIARKYSKWSKRDKQRLIETKIAPDGTIPETFIDVSFSTYKEQGHGAKQMVDLNAVAQQADSLDVMEAHQMSVFGDVLLSREKRIADKYMTAANYATGCTSAIGAGTNRWDVGPATSTADPLKDIRITMKTAVALGAVPNVAIASTPVLEYLRLHPKVVAAAGAKASDRAVSDDELAKLIGVSRIIEGKAKYDTTGNTGTGTPAYMWGKGFVLAKVTPGAGLNQQTFMKTFRHTDLSMRDERDGTKGVRGVTWLIATHEDADEIVMSDSAYLLDTVIS